jgi:hypothetical protein
MNIRNGPAAEPTDGADGHAPRGTVGSEFADVAVSLDYQANGVRLRLEDLRGGRVRYLDALELETIIWLPDEHLARLLDPSADRWRDD